MVDGDTVTKPQTFAQESITHRIEGKKKIDLMFGTICNKKTRFKRTDGRMMYDLVCAEKGVSRLLRLCGASNSKCCPASGFIVFGAFLHPFQSSSPALHQILSRV